MLDLFLYLEACMHILFLFSRQNNNRGIQAYTSWLHRRGIIVTADAVRHVSTGLAVARWDCSEKSNAVCQK